MARNIDDNVQTRLQSGELLNAGAIHFPIR